MFLFNLVTDQCISDPCQNNGACSTNSDGSGYTCTCASGFEGDQCETRKLNIDECKSQLLINLIVEFFNVIIVRCTIYEIEKMNYNEVLC